MHINSMEMWKYSLIQQLASFDVKSANDTVLSSLTLIRYMLLGANIYLKCLKLIFSVLEFFRY